jgi:hypothetical protein
MQTASSRFAPSPTSGMTDDGVRVMAQMPGGSNPFEPRQPSSPSVRVPVAYQDAERRWPGVGLPPTVWDPRADEFVRGMQGLIKYYRSRWGTNPPRGGDDEDCNDRWQREHERCREFIGKLRDPRYLDACYERANARHRLCVGNGGKPNPNEPEEYGLQDIPNDPAGR